MNFSEAISRLDVLCTDGIITDVQGTRLRQLIYSASNDVIDDFGELVERFFRGEMNKLQFNAAIARFVASH
jgi:hypothetical protein